MATKGGRSGQRMHRLINKVVETAEQVADKVAGIISTKMAEVGEKRSYRQKRAYMSRKELAG